MPLENIQSAGELFPQWMSSMTWQVATSQFWSWFTNSSWINCHRTIMMAILKLIFNWQKTHLPLRFLYRGSHFLCPQIYSTPPISLPFQRAAIHLHSNITLEMFYFDVWQMPSTGRRQKVLQTNGSLSLMLLQIKNSIEWLEGVITNRIDWFEYGKFNHSPYETCIKSLQ